MDGKAILERKRRVSLTVGEIALMTNILIKHGADPQISALNGRFLEILKEEHNPEHRRIVDAYRAAVNPQDGIMELDNDAEVSFGEDPGAYVMVWTWVPSVDADLCVQCNGDLSDREGYNGLCGSCVDRAAIAVKFSGD